MDPWAELIAECGFNAITMQDMMIVARSDSKRTDLSGYWQAFHKRSLAVFIDSFPLGSSVMDLANRLCRPLPAEAAITWATGSATKEEACPTWIATSPLLRNE